jgi:acyl carrier protein
MLRETIQNFLVDSAQVDPAKFQQPGLRVAELDLDSLGLVEMLFEVEDRYGFQIMEPMRYMDMTFDDMVTDIEQAVRERHGGELPEDGRATSR